MLAWHMYGRELYREKKALIEMDGRGTYVCTYLLTRGSMTE
jgi:hypothetical protein